MPLSVRLGVLPLSLVAATPALAEDQPMETDPAAQPAQGGPPPGIPTESVFDGDWLTIGLGAGLSPSYSGSDDYRVFPLPVITGSFGGIDFNPRPAGIAVDVVPDRKGKVSFDFGAALRVRSDRVDQVEDAVVELLPDLDRAVEIGPTAGVSIPGILNRFDSLSFSVDALWDIAGAHQGMTVSPGITYFTPVGRGTAVSLSLSTSIVDDDFTDYYYSVTPAQSAITGLPQFQADGGIESVGANLFMAFDLSGNALDGGWSLVAIGGYSRLVGDAKRTPFTNVRGSADQFLIGGGIGYTF